jgi:hypothetical protein
LKRGHEVKLDEAGEQSDKLTLINRPKIQKTTHRGFISEVGEGGVAVSAGTGVPAGAGTVLEEVADEHGQIHVAVMAVAPEALGNSRRPQPQVGHRRDPTDDGRMRDGQLLGEQHLVSLGREQKRIERKKVGEEKGRSQRNAAAFLLFIAADSFVLMVGHVDGRIRDVVVG